MTRNKKLLLPEYWKDKLLKSDIYGEIISRGRRLLLLQMLTFSDNIVSNSDFLRRIRNIIGKLQGTFANTFYSYRILCIELLHIGKLAFKNSLHRRKLDLIWNHSSFVPVRQVIFRISLFIWGLVLRYVEVVTTSTKTTHLFFLVFSSAEAIDSM